MLALVWQATGSIYEPTVVGARVGCSVGSREGLSVGASVGSCTVGGGTVWIGEGRMRQCGAVSRERVVK